MRKRTTLLGRRAKGQGLSKLHRLSDHSSFATRHSSLHSQKLQSMLLDLRSDTVTRPTPEMLRAMTNAPVGDDVFGEDPTVNELQAFAADMFGMEAALYCSSGTQTNQIAINVHTRPGDEVICSNLSHIYLYEGGGVAQNSGVSMRLLEGDRGRITAAQVLANINADDAHYPRTTLVSLENTVNKGGGALYDLNELHAIREVCSAKGLQLHCDGARLFNAMVAQGIDAKVFGNIFDSISICLSKGLGAPVGSLLLGTKDFIYRAHRRRKSMGGGMRQAGFIAAAGLYALQNNINRLQEDHARARAIGDAMRNLDWVKNIMPIDSNIVIAEMADGIPSAAVMVALAKENIKCFTFGNDKIRLVAHLDFNDDHLSAFHERVQRITREKLEEASKERLPGMY
jgi:threonine aldolase